MKRYLLALVAILLLTTSALASGIYQPIARGTVTQANMRISAVDGTAFIDFTAADVLTLRLGYLLKIRDSAGRLIQGFPKAVGTGETLAETNLLDDPGFDDDTKWSKLGTATVSGSKGNCVATNDALYQNKLKTTGALYNLSGVLSVTNVAKAIIKLSGASLTAAIYTTDFSVYLTQISGNTYPGVAQFGAGTMTLDNFFVRQVLTPSATGVTISSTKGGTTMNWATKDAAFNYNDPAGYTYEIYRVLQTPIIATSSILAGNALIDATDANAFAAPVGVDLSPYQDGRHILALYDASGYAALAWISATAPSGEALATTGGPLNDGEITKQSLSDWSGSSFHITSVDATHFTTDNVTNYVRQVSIIWNVGGLHKFVHSGSTGSGTVRFQQGTTVVSSDFGTSYYTASALTDYRLSSSAVTTVTMAAWSIKQVTMPAATGALLLSTKGGSRGWISKHASFNPNGAITAKILLGY